MEHGRIRTTPTGYGVIRVDAVKQITVPTIDVPSLAQTMPTWRGLFGLGAGAGIGLTQPRIAPAQ